MIEIKHDGPTMVVSQDNLADATKDGTWRLLATYVDYTALELRILADLLQKR